VIDKGKKSKKGLGQASNFLQSVTGTGQKDDSKPMQIEGPTNFNHDSHFGFGKAGIEVKI